MIFSEQDDKPRADLNRPWRTISGRAQLQGVRIHDLRHTVASFAVASGHSLYLTGKLLGHTRPETTQRYAHLADDAMQTAVEGIAQEIAAHMVPREGGTADVVEIGHQAGR